MNVKFSFNQAAVERRGYTMSGVHHTIKSLFAAHSFPCTVDGDTITFEDKGHRDDFATMWEIIMALLRSEWFTDCATSCVWQDESGEEDVLSQAGGGCGTA